MAKRRDDRTKYGKREREGAKRMAAQERAVAGTIPTAETITGSTSKAKGKGPLRCPACGATEPEVGFQGDYARSVRRCQSCGYVHPRLQVVGKEYPLPPTRRG